MLFEIKIKNLLISFLCCSITMCLMYQPTKIFAEKNAEKSEAIIEFISNETKPVYLDPLHMNRELDASYLQNGHASEAGALRLDYVHTPDFKKNIDEVRHLSNHNHNYIQISDMTGNGAGWLVTARLDDKKMNDSRDSIKGMEIQFENQSVQSNGVSEKPNIKEQISIKPNDDSIIIAEAEPKSGKGIWIQDWKMKMIQPNNTKSHKIMLQNFSKKSKNHDEYIPNMTWTLISAPFN